MADERKTAKTPDDAPEAQDKSKAQKKEKKKRSKFSVFLWMLVLLLGCAVGLHLSGMWDGRPLLWSVVPKLPWIGQPLSEILQVPAQYSLTVGERRELELADWQKRLDARERELSQQVINLEQLSGDINDRLIRVSRREEAVAQAERDSQDSDAATPSEQALIDQVARTYQEMSARNAASIIEQLREKLAVDLLRKLPNDARSSILSKMNATKAARLTDLLTRKQ